MTERRLILVADHSAVVRAVVHAHLSSHGFEVIEAVDGPGTVEAFRARRPDVVLLDVDLPGLDGFGSWPRSRTTRCPRIPRSCS